MTGSNRLAHFLITLLGRPDLIALNYFLTCLTKHLAIMFDSKNVLVEVYRKHTLCE